MLKAARRHGACIGVILRVVKVYQRDLLLAARRDVGLGVRCRDRSSGEYKKCDQ